MKKIENWIEAFRPSDGPPPKTLKAFIGWCLSSAWPMLILAALLSAGAGAMEAGTALILGLVVDAVVATGSENFYTPVNITMALFAIGFFIVARPVMFALSSGANHIVVMPNIATLVQSRLHRWSLGQSVTFFDDDFAGRIAQKQMQTARAVTDVVSETINVVAFALASLLGSFALLGAIDWRVAGFFLIWLVFYFALIAWFLPRIRVRAATRANARAVVSGQLVDTITNIKTVKLFAHDVHEDEVALDAMAKFRAQSLHYGWLAAGFRFCLMVIAGILPVLLMGSAVYFWQLGQATPGDIVAAGAVSIRIAQMTGWVSFTLMAIYSNIGEIEDGMNTLAAPVRVEDSADAHELAVPNGAIQFDNVSFQYGNALGGVSDLSLNIRAGEKIGIVGGSGAGKSTLVSLLLRLYEAEQGRILIDDQPLQDVTQTSLRQSIGMVTQETAMFNRSARENILYGRHGASEAEMIHAAEQAEAHGFIADLRDGKQRAGYDAHLGERGVKLSGGQRQRIALARAILKDAPILVLDEATSALDSEVEASIQSALERAMEGKTVLAIAHRLSTLSQMDRIIVLDQGRIVEDGTHDSLLSKDGLYARYWNRQSGGFIDVRSASK
ncbi:ABC transporter ATP-binding protein [Planktotalea sp.]|uniref:ABC transporter ATP-binding protein n=1 Tax=Planktotalea sp. TaxID=2029877 RepID=UPI003D6BAE4E